MNTFRKPIIVGLICLLICLVHVQARAQFGPPGGIRLSCTGSTGTAYCGSAVALSADGNTAVVGGMFDGDTQTTRTGAGAVWVFTRTNGAWNQQGNKLVGTGAIGDASQGRGVSLSADGNTLIVGGLFDNNRIGAAWIFTRANGVWTQQGSKFVGAGAVGESYQGLAVYISADGNSAIVGGPGDNGSQGAAWIFTRSGGTWSQQGGKLAIAGSTSLGAQVSLSSNGNTALISGLDHNNNLGGGWIFTRVNGTWSQQGIKLVGANATQGGADAILSADGNTAAISAGSSLSVFTLTNGKWIQQGPTIPASLAGWGGQRLSMSVDGNSLLAAATYGASLFTRSIGSWNPVPGKLLLTAPTANLSCASISGDGNTAIIGSPDDNSTLGGAWIFSRNGKTGLIPLILIPGIMGSPLYDDQIPKGILDYAERCWVNLSRPVTTLYLANDGFNPPPGSNYDIIPSPVRNDSWTLRDELALGLVSPMDNLKTLVNHLESELGYILDDSRAIPSKNNNLFIFTYDWRKSVDWNGTGLAQFINSVKGWTGASQVDLVAHSMGGLVAKAAIAQGSKSSVRKLIFIGTPHLGAPKSIYSSLTGIFLDGWVDVLFRNDQIVELMRNLPSGYQLFPTRYFVQTYGPVFSTDYGATNVMLDFDQTNSFLINRGFNQPIISDINRVQENLRHTDLGGIEVHNIVGTGFDTPGKVGSFAGTTTIVNTEMGDKTVPLRSARNGVGLGQVTQYVVSSVDHTKLPSANPVWTYVKGILASTSGAMMKVDLATRDTTSETSTSLQFAVYGSGILHVYDSMGRHTGSLTDTSFEEGIPESQYVVGNLKAARSPKIVNVPRGEYYSLVIENPDSAGGFSLLVDNIVNGNDQETIGFESVALPQGANATCNISMSLDTLQIGVDSDNNGIVDTVYHPSLHLVTGINVEDKHDFLPERALLAQNYPNPFNPSTTIKYELPNSLAVRLTVFDLLGREVSVLVNDRRNAGIHEVKFDGLNLASGVYFYRLQAGTYVETKKLLLIR